MAPNTKRIILFMACLFCTTILFSQAQGIDELPNFVKDNLPGFTTTRLSNGIPVYIKKNDANRVRTIMFVLKGGSLTAIPDQAGWQKIALATMTRASTNYPYETVVELLDATSSSIGSSVNFEYGIISLNVLDKYFDRLLPIWADMIVHPAFGKSDVDQAKSEVELAIQSKEQDPWALAGRVMNEAFFKGHPYSINPDGTEASIAPANPEAMMRWYEANVSADRAFVVAVGDFDTEELGMALDSSLGTLQDKSLGPIPSPQGFFGRASGGLIRQAHEASRGVAYVRGDFPAPKPTAPDFMAANVAMKLFSDLLFSVVRDTYGAAYTPGSVIRSFESNYGSISIYKTSVPDSIKSYIDETASILASGRCVSVDPSRPGEESQFMELTQALDTYKRMFINEYFAAVRTNSAIARLMAGSILRTGDPADWLFDVVRIRSLSPEDILGAFKTYVLDGAYTWVAVGDPELLEKMPEEAY
jgi:zinc protease